MTNNTKELLPCPFCDHIARQSYITRLDGLLTYYVECGKSCGARIELSDFIKPEGKHVFHSPEANALRARLLKEVAEAWNTRHIATQPRPDKPLITPEANKGLSQLRDLVIILDDDAKAEIKDLVETDFGFGFVTDVQDNNFNLALYTGNRNILKDGAWFRNFSPKIIQRQGKPCIYRSQLNKQEGGCE